MKIGILKEREGEHRVSALPEAVAQLIQLKAEVFVEKGAGTAAFASDSDYEKAGAKLFSREDILRGSQVLLSIGCVPKEDLKLVPKETVMVGTFHPLFRFREMNDSAEAGIATFSLDMLPRTTRAQSMDVLSSQANIAGYKAVVLAAHLYGRYFPMLMTAAGSVAPAKVLILGAGVAGLQAIATAKRLGAVVEVFDTRPAVKEEVQSLGAKFIEVEGAADASKAGGYAVEQSEEYKQRQRNRIAEAVAKSDIVITTAQIPGKKAPVLVTRQMIESMRSGSVIVDMAASTGGNCEGTRNNEVTNLHGVRIAGYSNLASSMPADASKLYGKNIINFLKLIMTADGNLHLNFEDDLVKGSCVTHAGVITNDRVKELVGSQHEILTSVN